MFSPWAKDSTWSSSSPCNAKNEISSQNWKKTAKDVGCWRRLVIISDVILTRLVNLFDPKYFVSLNVDQANLDQCKASGLIDKSYHLTLDELEGLPPQPQVIKMFKKGCFTYDDFLNLLSSQRNASAPGLNGIPYKVYKKNSGLCKFLFQILKCAFSKGETPLQWQNAKETNPQIKSTIQKLNLRFLTNCSSKYWR